MRILKFWRCAYGIFLSIAYFNQQWMILTGVIAPDVEHTIISYQCIQNTQFIMGMYWTQTGAPV